MPSDGPLRKLVGWIDAGVSRCAGAGGDGRRRPFPTALVLAGGAPLGCLAALFRKLVAGILAIFFPQTLYSSYGLGAKVS